MKNKIKTKCKEALTVDCTQCLFINFLFTRLKARATLAVLEQIHVFAKVIIINNNYNN